MRKKLLFLLVVLATSIGFAQGQTRQVSGRVLEDGSGEALAGATVLQKGTSNATMTDVDGHFTISVPAGATLVISSIGHVPQEVPAANAMVVRLVADEAVLDEVEVISIAYGTTTRAQFTGSAAVVGGDELLKRTTSNITNSLQGTAAGVQVVSGSGQPGTGATIRIRGVGSINGGRAPLYIVDGTPFDESVLNLVNPYDVESITILKDAASTAIYGARGANGVVLITTKRGGDTKTKVTVDAKWGYLSRAVPNYNVMTEPGMYYETAYKALYNSQIYAGFGSIDAFKYADANIFSKTGVGYQVYTVPAGERLIGSNFKLNPNATLGYSDGTYYYTPDDWTKETLKKGSIRQEYNFQVAGGNDKTNYFVSAGYLDNPGLIDGSSFKRYTISGNVESQVKSWLKIGINTNYAYSNAQQMGKVDEEDGINAWGSSANVFDAMNLMAPVYPFYVRNADGSIKVDNNGYKVYDSGSNTGFTRSGSAPMGNYAINLKINQNYDYTDFMSTNIYAAITPVKGLVLTARVIPNVSNDRIMSLYNPWYDATGLSTDGMVEVEHVRNFTLNQQYIADYSTLIGDIHKLHVLAGWETYTLKYQVLDAWNDHLFNPYIGELGNAFGINPANQQMTSSTDNFATAGAFGRVQYDLKNRYFLNGTVRYEGSSRFSPDNRWGTFWSVGGAWLMSNESFMGGVKNLIQELKLKASYGTQGNDQLRNYYAYRSLWNIAYNSATGQYTRTLSAYGNPDLKWEAQKLFNAGVEFSLFNQKLYGSVEYFNRNNSDMLFLIPLPVSSGIVNVPKNIATARNRGVEIDLASQIINTKNFGWLVSANITFLKSKILKLPDYVNNHPKKMMEYTAYCFKVGGSLNEAYLVEYAGVDPKTGLSQYYKDPDKGDYSLTTNFTDAKQADLGDISIDAFGGFGTTINFYGFDIGAQFAYQFGGKAYDGTYQEFMHTGHQIGRNWSMDILNAWTPENPNSNIPRLNSSDDFDQQTSSRWLTSSNFLSINSLTLGYVVPVKYLSKLQISSLRFYITGDNLALFSARKGFDPRQIQNQSAVGVGWSTNTGNYVYSQMRSISSGLTVSF